MASQSQMSWNSCQLSLSQIQCESLQKKEADPAKLLCYCMFWGTATFCKHFLETGKKKKWVAKKNLGTFHTGFVKPCYWHELRLNSPARYELQVFYIWGSWDTGGGLCTILALSISIFVRAEIILSWRYNSPLPTVPAVIMVQRYIIQARLFPLPNMNILFW